MSEDKVFRLPEVVPIGATDPPAETGNDAIVFEPLRAFLARDLPPAESLVGVTRGGTNLLPRYGWVMPWGREGSGKTSILVDLLFHAAAGIDWLGYTIERPVRVVCIVNEGIPGGFQDKLRQKLDTWPHDRDAVQDNLAVYASPWGAFTFADAAMAAHAYDYAHDFAADYLALDPLHTLGTTGAGSPAETEQFKHTLRHFGVWDSIGVITAHHSNKLGIVSGDWGRHPDTVIRIEKDGKNPATKLTLEKARPADPAELGVPFMLEWDVETFGYVRRALPEATPKVSDDELEHRIRERLEATGKPESKTSLRKTVQGANDRIGDVIEAGIERGVFVNIATTPGRITIRLPEGDERVGRLPFEGTDNGSVEPKKPSVEGNGWGVAGAEGETVRPSVPPERGERSRTTDGLSPRPDKPTEPDPENWPDWLRRD